MYTQVILNLLLVLGLMAVYLYATWKLKTIKPNKNKAIEIESMINIGQKEKVILLKVGEQRLLIGATSTNISLLMNIIPDIESAHERQNQEVFRRKIQDAENSMLANRNIQ